MWKDEAHEAFNLLDKADEQQGVENIEGCMECRKAEKVVATGMHHIVDHPSHGVTEGIEKDKHHDNSKYIEEHVCQSGPACLGVCGERSHECRDGGTDVLTHGKCCRLFEAETRNLHVEQHERDGHGSGRSLHQHCDQSTDNDKKDNGKKASIFNVCKHSCHKRTDFKTLCRLLQEGETHKEEAEAEHEFSDTLALVVAAEDERNAKSQQWQGKGRYVHFETDG